MSEYSVEQIANMLPVPESALDNLGMKWVNREFHVAGNADVKDCAGCGFPIDANNPRSYEVTPGASLYSHYGPCCAPRGKKLKKAKKIRKKRFGF